MLGSKPTKGQYSEAEAASALGLSVEQLRCLIRNHIVEREEDLSNLSSANFHPSDLLVLRMILAGMPASSMLPH
jgi:hypothetical protein